MMTAGFHRVALLLLTVVMGSHGAAIACSATGIGLDGQPDWHCLELAAGLSLYYKVEVEEDMLYLGVQAQNHDGWVGIGINGNGGMKGGSFIIVRKQNDAWVAEDRYALEYAMPILDEHQDVVLVDAQESGGDITWIVKLPLGSCDIRDYQIKDMFQRVLWAKGPSHTFVYHGNQVSIDRGSTEVNFYRAPVQVNDPTDAFTIDFRMPNIKVESAEGGNAPEHARVCAAFSLAELGVTGGPYHVTKYSAFLSPASSKYVRQVVVNPCFGIDVPSFVNTSEDPSTWYQTDCGPMLECRYSGVHFAWSVGAGDVVFPEEAGYMISLSEMKYFTMQVQYYNPTRDADIIDSSGLRLTVTPTLRSHNIGIYTLNGGGSDLRPAWPLPAGEERALQIMQVPPPCLDNAWPSIGPDRIEEMTLLRVFHHQHLKGTSVQIRVISGDDEDQGLLRTEKRFDLNHQFFAPAEVTKLRRTDKLFMMCEYDTMGDNDSTTFGSDLQQEMCLGEIYYYPAVSSLYRGQFATAMRAAFGTNRTWCPGGITPSEPFQFVPKENFCNSSDPTSDISSSTTSTVAAVSTSVANSAERVVVTLALSITLISTCLL